MYTKAFFLKAFQLSFTVGWKYLSWCVKWLDLRLLQYTTVSINFHFQYICETNMDVHPVKWNGSFNAIINLDVLELEFIWYQDIIDDILLSWMLHKY